jgi:peroxiredoxin
MRIYIINWAVARPLNFLIGEISMIEVGKPAPDFELASHLAGTKFTLSQFKGQKNVMLVFYPLDSTPT